MTPPAPPRYTVLGVGVSAVDLGSARDRIMDAARSRSPLGASALAVHAVMEAQSDPSYRARLNALDLALADGQPVRWALNCLHGAGLRERVYGPFLMREVCAAAALEGISVYLFGGTPELLGRLAARLRTRHPGLRLAGQRASRFRRATAEEAREDAAAIRSSGAQVVFCGLGCPRQEAWVHAMTPLIGVPLLGVGAAFSLWAGDRAMAPRWMQDHGLEWLYRLGQEPRRLARRYLLQGPGFFLRVGLQRLGRRPPPLASAEAPSEYWG